MAMKALQDVGIFALIKMPHDLPMKGLRRNDDAAGFTAGIKKCLVKIYSSIMSLTILTTSSVLGLLK